MRLASRFSSSPTPTTARPDGVAPHRLGRIDRVADVASHDLGPLVERPGAGAEDQVEGAGVDVPGGALDGLGGHAEGGRDLLTRRRESVASGDLHEEADGRDELDAVRSMSGYLSSCSLANSWTKPTVSSLKTSSAWKNMPSSRDDRVSSRSVSRSCDHLRVLVDPLHGVGLQLELALDDHAADEDHQRATTSEYRRGRAGRPPSHTTSRPSGASRKSRPLVGDLYSRMPRTASGSDDAAQADHRDADGEQQAEVADHRHLGEPQGGEGEDRVERHDEQRGAEVLGRLLDRVRLPVDDHLLLDPRVHLDRVVDAHAEHDRQAGDRDDRQRDAEVAGQAEGPDDADEDDAERQEPPPHLEGDEQDDAPSVRRRWRRA